MPALAPIKTGIPAAPSNSHVNTIKKDCRNGKRKAISSTIKFRNVIWDPVGRGMLMYAETHNTAVNNAMVTKERVRNCVWLFIISYLINFFRNPFTSYIESAMMSTVY